MSGVAVGLVVFVISGMIERGWFHPFELDLFEIFTNPYVAIPCLVASHNKWDADLPTKKT